MRSICSRYAAEWLPDITQSDDSCGRAVPPRSLSEGDDGGVPSPKDMRQAAESLRKLADRTTGLPEDSPADAQLRDRLELAADVLDAGAEAEEPPTIT
jgi:hypothetical protein